MSVKLVSEEMKNNKEVVGLEGGDFLYLYYVDMLRYTRK